MIFQQCIRAYFFLLFKFKNIRYQSFPVIRGFPTIKAGGKITFGQQVKINSGLRNNPVGLSNQCLIICLKNAEVIIGNNVGISNALLYARIKITLEDDTMIGGGCQILDNDFHAIQYAHRMQRPDTNIAKKAVHIKKGAFIGTNSIILKGVTIGERSVVAAGSVVTKDVPNDEIWGGNPAIFIRKIQ